MIKKIGALFVRGWRIARTHEQFLFTLGLLIVIPLAFLWSGQQFLTIAREHAERTERARIGLLHDSLSALYMATGDTAILRRMVTDIAHLNPDLSRLLVVSYKDGAPDADVLIGNPVDLRELEGFFRTASMNPDESYVFEMYEDGIRHWIGIRGLVFDAVTPSTFVVTDFSMEGSDALFRNEVRRTYAYLGGILLLLMFLVVRHARIINYAVLYRELQKALEAKTVFINMTAHELRAPLTALRGYASMIREHAIGQDKVLEYAGRTEESAGYLIKLVSDLLDVAKLESGGMALSLEKISVTDVVTRTVSRLESLGKEHKISLMLEPPRETMYINVDTIRFEEILTNLISNAIKYTVEGKVSISMENVNDKCELRIKDTGIGMSAEDREKLFSPYFRSSEVEKGAIVGTGLGLWITKRFIEAMKGNVSVESIHGVGTHIVVDFPLA